MHSASSKFHNSPPHLYKFTIHTITQTRILRNYLGMAKEEFDVDDIKSDEKQTISFNYLVEGLEMGVDEVERVKNIMLRNLQRKLCLVLDLDHTLLQTLSPPQKLDMSHYEGDDIFQWELPGVKLITKLRPFVRQFLEEASEMFELYVYTMASRDYALHIFDELLDPQVITREDCTIAGQKGLDVVPVHPSAVLILDDTEWVWKRNLGNLILIDKYDYFSQVGRDESEEAGELSFALEVLTKLHSVYFQWYDRFKDGDVRELVQNYWEDFINDEGQKEVGAGTCSSDMGFGKRSRVDDDCSSNVTKKQKIC